MSTDSQPAASLSSPAAARPLGAPKFMPMLLLMVTAGGFAAMIYGLVSFQRVELIIGSSAGSIGLMLAMMLGGICLGSLLSGRFAPVRWHPLKVYAALELKLGVMGLLLMTVMSLGERLYVSMAGPGPSMLSGMVICGIFLLLPAMLFGAGLPAIAGVEVPSRRAGSAGIFYGGSLLGLAGGALFAGFCLWQVLDLNTAAYAAAGVHILIGVAALALARRAGRSSEEEPLSDQPEPLTAIQKLDRILIFLTLALCGLTTIGALSIWNRHLGQLFGGTIYALSIILSVFLGGLGVGGIVGALFTRHAAQPRLVLAWCLGLCALGIAWTTYVLTIAMPNWPVAPSVAMSAAARSQLDMARCCWALLPPALFWGASFPLALAALATARKGAGVRAVGGPLAIQAAGATAGILFFSLFAVRAWGTQGSTRILIVLTGLAALLMAIAAAAPGLPALRSAIRTPRPKGSPKIDHSTTIAALCTLLLVAGVIGGTMFVLVRRGMDRTPWQLVAFGREVSNSARKFPYRTMVEMREGLGSSVAVTRDWDNTVFFHTARNLQTSTGLEESRLQLMLGHLPSMFHAGPKRVLVLGCGTGITAGSFLMHLPQRDPNRPDDVQLVICEMEPLVSTLAAAHFHSQNNEVLTRKVNGDLLDPRVRIVHDDPRHYLLTTGETFDIITSEPIHPSLRAASATYTREFFELLKTRLNPGGIVMQWVPLYDSNMAVVKGELRTFFDAFPSGMLWSNDRRDKTDLLLMGSVEPVRMDAALLQKKMDNLLVKATFSKVNLSDLVEVLKPFAGTPQDLQSWMADGEIFRDANLRLQFLAGRALREDRPYAILEAIQKHRTYPEMLVNLPAEQRHALEEAWSFYSPSIRRPESR